MYGNVLQQTVCKAGNPQVCSATEFMTKTVGNIVQECRVTDGPSTWSECCLKEQDVQHFAA